MIVFKLKAYAIPFGEMQYSKAPIIRGIGWEGPVSYTHLDVYKRQV